MCELFQAKNVSLKYSLTCEGRTTWLTDTIVLEGQYNRQDITAWLSVRWTMVRGVECTVDNLRVTGTTPV